MRIKRLNPGSSHQRELLRRPVLGGVVDASMEGTRCTARRRRFQPSQMTGKHRALTAAAVVAFLSVGTGPRVGSEAFVVHGFPRQQQHAFQVHHEGCVAALPKYIPTSTHRHSIATAGDGSMTEEDDVDDVDDMDIVDRSAAWLNEPAYNPTKSSDVALRRTLGVDWGFKRVGLAVGVGISPRIVPGVTNRGSDVEVVRQVLLRARGEGIRDVVVGLPLMRNGTECGMCYRVREFSLVLADAGAISRQPISVYLWDERFTSAQAEAMLDRHGGKMSKKVEIDSLAAGLILKHYFAEKGQGAEKIQSSGHRNPQLLKAAGVADDGGESSEKTDGVDEDEIFGENLKAQRYRERAESLKAAAAGDFVPFMKPPKRKRKKRR